MSPRTLNQYKLLYYFIFIIAIVRLMNQLYFVNRGFDITDEAWHLLLINDSKVYNNTIHEFHNLIRYLPIKFNIVNLRLIKIAVTIINCIIITAIARKSFEINLNIFYVFLIVFVGSSFITTNSRCISYYDLIELFAYISILFFLYKKFFLSGFFIGLMLAVRMPTAIVFATFYVFILYSLYKWNKRNYLFTFLGIITSLTFLIYSRGGLIHFIENYTEGIKYSMALGKSIYGILRNYIIDLISALTFILPIIYFLKKQNLSLSVKTFVSTLIYIVIIFSIKYFAIIDEIYFDEYLIYYHIFFAFFVLLEKPIKGKSILVCFYFLLPLILNFGSTAYMTVGIHAFIAPWIITTIYLVKSSKDLLKLYIIYVIFFSSVQFFISQVFRPYGEIEPLTIQKQATNFPNGEKIFLDNASTRFFKSTKVILHDNGFNSGDTILIAKNMPGLTYYLNSYSDVNVWLRKTNQICYLLRNLNSRPKFMILHDNIDSKSLDCINRYTSNTTYSIIGKTTHPISEDTICIYKRECY